MNRPEICVIGVKHTQSSIELREQLALDTGPSAVLSKGNFSYKDELVVLSTCNRTELIACSADPDLPARLTAAWAAVLDLPPDFAAKQLVVRTGAQAVQHVFKVASGLDSMLLGESQILGQVKQAYARAVHEGATGALLNKLFHRAFYTAKQVRTQTRLSAGRISLANVVIELACAQLGNLDRVTAVLTGAGEMGRLVALQLAAKGCRRIIIASRTQENAALLAGNIGGESIAVQELSACLPETDLLISAWGGDGYVVGPDVLRPREGRPLLCFDLSLPRTLDPSLRAMLGLTLYDLDDIQLKINTNRKAKEKEAEAGLRIVEAQTTRFLAWQESLELEQTIADLYQHTREIVETELSRTLRALPDLEHAEVVALEKMAKAIVKKINYYPVTYLKRFQARHGDPARQLSMLRSMFNLNEEE